MTQATTPASASLAHLRSKLLRGGRLTKINGIVASDAPQVGELTSLLKPMVLAVSMALGGALLAVAGTVLPVSEALAACTGGPNTYTCSGISTGESISGPVAHSVTFDSTFNGTGPGPGYYPFLVEGTAGAGSQTVTIDTAATLSQTTGGGVVRVLNNGTGSLLLTSAGTITDTSPWSVASVAAFFAAGGAGVSSLTALQTGG